MKNQKTDGTENVRYEKTKMQREQIIKRLREEGCRITKQRLTLLDIILEEECSCCKEIYYKASAKDAGIGMATVYRMVNMLERIGAISRKNLYRVSCGDGEQRCENRACKVELSDHTICRLSPGMWNNVIRAGLKEYGYIADQEIENIMLQAYEDPA